MAARHFRQIVVKTTRGSFLGEYYPEETVAEFGRRFAAKHGMDPRVRFIVAGEMMQPEQQMMIHDLPRMGCIHGVVVLSSRYHPGEPLPFADLAENLLQAAEFSNMSVYVWCEAPGHLSCGEDSFGVPYHTSLQPGAVRVRCSECLGECVSLSERAGSWIAFFAKETEGHCHQCDCATKIEFVFRCNGEMVGDGERTLCKRTDAKLLPCVIKNTTGALSCDTGAADSVQVSVHPCGHRVGANGLKDYFNGDVRDKLLRNPNPLTNTLGDHVGRCVDAQCKRGFLPLMTLQLAEDDAMDRITEYRVAEVLLANGGIRCGDCRHVFLPPLGVDYCVCPKCEGHHCCEHGVYECHHDRMDSKIRLAFARGGTRKCPGCGALGVKDDKCTHITCSKCRTQWCYVCEHKHEGTVYACHRGCPLWLHETPEGRGKSGERCVFEMHRAHVHRLLRDLRATNPHTFDATYASLPEHECLLTLVSGAQEFGELMELSTIHMETPRGPGLSFIP